MSPKNCPRSFVLNMYQFPRVLVQSQHIFTNAPTLPQSNPGLLPWDYFYCLYRGSNQRSNLPSSPGPAVTGTRRSGPNPNDIGGGGGMNCLRFASSIWILITLWCITAAVGVMSFILFKYQFSRCSLTYATCSKC
jgi:hypothetical protein